MSPQALCLHPNLHLSPTPDRLSPATVQGRVWQPPGAWPWWLLVPVGGRPGKSVNHSDWHIWGPDLVLQHSGFPVDILGCPHLMEFGDVWPTGQLLGMYVGSEGKTGHLDWPHVHPSYCTLYRQVSRGDTGDRSPRSGQGGSLSSYGASPCHLPRGDTKLLKSVSQLGPSSFVLLAQSSTGQLCPGKPRGDGHITVVVITQKGEGGGYV